MSASKQPVGYGAYDQVDDTCCAKRMLCRYAGVRSLWALGVGAVISSHFSAWNPRPASGGFGGLLLAAVVIG